MDRTYISAGDGTPGVPNWTMLPANSTTDPSEPTEEQIKSDPSEAFRPNSLDSSYDKPNILSDFELSLHETVSKYFPQKLDYLTAIIPQAADEVRRQMVKLAKSRKKGTGAEPATLFDPNIGSFSIAADVTILQNTVGPTDGEDPEGAFTEEKAIEMLNRQLNQTDPIGVDLFLVGGAYFNYYHSTINGELFLSKPLQNITRRFITLEHSKTSDTDAIKVVKANTAEQIFELTHEVTYYTVTFGGTHAGTQAGPFKIFGHVSNFFLYSLQYTVNYIL